MTTSLGNQAESVATHYLEQQGLRILARNWRNRWCEIDIVAQDKDKAVHFVEVKYRRTAQYGSGLDYITNEKTGRLARASQIWMKEYGLDVPYQIDVIAIAGDLARPKIDYLPNAITG